MICRSLSAILWAAPALLAATVAAALEPAACLDLWVNESSLPLPDEDADNYRLRSQSGQVTDMGQGMVASRYENVLSGSRQEGVVFFHCTSGRTLTAEIGSWRDGHAPELYPDPIALMRAALDSPQVMTLDEVRAAYLPHAWVSPPTGQESCGCAVFYPELRGNQTPFGS
jgi:hypothetical protein